MQLLFFVCLLLSFGISFQERRIIGGLNVNNIADYGHQVSVRIHPEKVFGERHICGGSLIDSAAYPNSSVVLTAAHCVHDPDDRPYSPKHLIVVAGNLKRFEKEDNSMSIKVIKIISHERYKPEDSRNDIAMLVLAEKIPKDHPTVKPIKIGQAKPGQVCQAIGWGRSDSVSEL